jgi:2-iminobutanoate/2-iminopropanoate deaminase
MTRKAIQTTPGPRGHRPLFTGNSGPKQPLPVRPARTRPRHRQLVEGGVTAQAAQALKNIQAICTAAGFTMADIVQVQVLLTNIADFAAVNAVYKDFFQEPYPARAAFAVAALPANGAVEILAVAMK